MLTHEQIDAIRNAYRTTANTYGHGAFVIERRMAHDKTDNWEPICNMGDMMYDYITVPASWAASGKTGQTLMAYRQGKHAAENADYLKANFPDYTYRIKKYQVTQAEAEHIEASNTWKAREQQRMTDGTYTPLPWADEPWFKERHAELNHFAHVSLHDHGKIAFTRDDEQGKHDRQTRITVGKYLNQYFRRQLDDQPRRETGSVNVLGEKITIDALQWYVRTFQQTYGAAETLKFAYTADDMVNVYLSGPDSCMSKDTSDYDSHPRHPVEVYAAGDLALAYLEDESGEITARALVWPEKKAVGRVYGDDMALQSLLREQGYSPSDWGSLEGARLRKIPAHDGYVMPYIDGCQSYGPHPDGKHWQIGGMHSASLTNGLDHELGTCTCEHCGDRMDEGEAYLVYINRFDDGEHWCQSCFEHDAYTCEETSNSYSGRVPCICIATGGYVATHNAENYGQCSITHEWHHIYDLSSYRDDGDWVSNDAIRDHALVQDGDGNWWKADECPQLQLELEASSEAA